jgi:acyl-CoA synthetase (AMP-forming)/AMP-acid ligase II
MKNLTQHESGFLVNWEALVALRTGDQQNELAPLGPTKIPVAEAELLLADSRGAFIHGLSKILARGNPALLCPHPALLTSMKVRSLLREHERHMSEDGRCFVPNEAPLIEVVTSGSTGQPQVHQKTAYTLLTEVSVLVQLLELDEGDTVIATTASHHLYGLLFGLLTPWAVGAGIVADSRNEADAFHPEGIAALCRETAATLLVTVPAHLRSLTEAKPNLGGLRKVACSAAPLSLEDAERFEDAFSIPIVDVLGSTETGGIATRRAAKTRRWRPLPGVQVDVDEKQRLLIRSPFLTGREQVVTDERARLYPDGCFEYLGRDDGVIKIGGKRVHLHEIETAARALDGVTNACALSRPVDSMRGHELLLIVEGKGLQSIKIKRSLRASLDPTFVPRRVRVVDRMPVDDRGKLTRATALALFDIKEIQHPKAQAAALQSPSMKSVMIQISEDDLRFSGHFPGAPVYPGVATLLDLVLPQIKAHYGYEQLHSLRRIKWLQPVKGEASLLLQLSKSNASEDTVRFELLREGQKICRGIAQFEPTAATPSQARLNEEPS